MVRLYPLPSRPGIRHRLLPDRSLRLRVLCIGLPPKGQHRLITCEIPVLMLHSLQLLRPEFSWLVEPDDKTKIFDLIARLIQTLNSPEVSIDNKHTPKLHAKFLAGLLAKLHQDSNQDPLSQEPLPPSKHTVGGGPVSYGGRPQPSSASSEHFGQGQGTTQSTSMPQGGFGEASYTSDPNVSYTHEAPQYQLQTSDGVAAAQDNAVNAMAGLSEEDMLATLRAIGNPNWWSNVMMPGYDRLVLTVIWRLIYICTNSFSWPSPTSTGSPECSGTIPASSFSSSSSLSGATGFGGGFEVYPPAQTASISLY